jgi:hypothetical protein
VLRFLFVYLCLVLVLVIRAWFLDVFFLQRVPLQSAKCAACSSIHVHPGRLNRESRRILVCIDPFSFSSAKFSRALEPASIFRPIGEVPLKECLQILFLASGFSRVKSRLPRPVIVFRARSAERRCGQDFRFLRFYPVPGPLLQFSCCLRSGSCP